MLCITLHLSERRHDTQVTQGSKSPRQHPEYIKKSNQSRMSDKIIIFVILLVVLTVVVVVVVEVVAAALTWAKSPILSINGVDE